jgi:hypothetical protein
MRICRNVRLIFFLVGFQGSASALPFFMPY